MIECSMSHVCVIITCRLLYELSALQLMRCFRGLQAQQEAKAREQEEEPGVRPHMLRRLSTPKKPDDPELRRGNERVTAVAASHPLNSSHPSNSHSSRYFQ